MCLLNLFCIFKITFFFIYSLESPFRKILNTAQKHEEKDYDCTILSNTCPFNNKQFIQKIELGQQKPKEFMDEIMETVVSDLNKPLKSNHFKISSTGLCISILLIINLFPKRQLTLSNDFIN